MRIVDQDGVLNFRLAFCTGHKLHPKILPVESTDRKYYPDVAAKDSNRNVIPIGEIQSFLRRTIVHTRNHHLNKNFTKNELVLKARACYLQGSAKTLCEAEHL